MINGIAGRMVLVQRRDTRSIGFVVVAEKFDETAREAAPAVDIVPPDLVRELR
ncbi:MAG: hypothetical protein WDO56_19655 [Gammaproteobacteria bacterium]